MKGDLVEALQVLKCQYKSNYYRGSDDPQLTVEEAQEEKENDEEALLEELEKEVEIVDLANDILESDEDCFE